MGSRLLLVNRVLPQPSNMNNESATAFAEL